MTLIVALTVICCASFYLISSKFSTETLDSTIEDDMSQLSQAVSNALEKHNDIYITLMKSFAAFPFVTDTSLSLEERQTQLDYVTRSNPNLSGFNVSDENGISWTHEMGLFDFKVVPGITDALSGVQGIADPELNKVNGGVSMMYYMPLRDESNRIIGCFFVGIDGSVLSEICSEFQIAKTGYVMVVNNKTGLVVADKDIQNVKDGLNLKDFQNIDGKEKLADLFDLMQTNATGQIYMQLNGEKNLVSYCPVKNSDWSVISVAPYNEFSYRLVYMRILLTIVFVVLLVIGGAISVFVGKSIKPLSTVGKSIEEIASGNADLTKRISVKRTQKEIAGVVDGFNKFSEKLHNIMSEIKSSKENLSNVGSNLESCMQDTSSAITEIIANIQSVNSQIQNQSNSVQSTAGAVNEIASNIESLEHMIENQSNGVSQASAAVEEMVGNINSVNSAVEKMVGSFAELQSKTAEGITMQNNVNEKIDVIQGESQTLQEANSAISAIAEQTNLLAMNAAIEAAHAGDAGKGFSVVADEIRKLSETSSEQSKTIGDQLTKIQESISSVVEASEKSASAFNDVALSIKSTDQIIQQIRAAMEEQQIGSKQIIDVLQTMNDSTFEVKNAGEEMAAGNKQILDEVKSLQNATIAMKESVGEISTGAERINTSGAELSELSTEIGTSINRIGGQIDEFKV